MKLNYQPKPEKTDVLSLRLPRSLVRRFKALRVRADKLDEAYTGPIANLMEQVADEFEAHLQKKEAAVYKTDTELYTEQPPPVSLSNGSDQKQA